MRDIEITTREILVSIVIVLLLVALGFFISNSIHNAALENSEKYFKSLKINNDAELFDYALATEVGNVLAYGTLKANEPVSDKLLDGTYFSILKIEEHYVQKTRTVTYTDSNGKTQTKIETYWEWEEYKRDYFNTDTFTFLGKVLDYNLINFDFHTYQDTIKEGGFFSDVRYVFYTIPFEFNASLFAKAKDGTIINNTLYVDQTIKEVIKQKEESADTSVIVFWVFWSILIFAAVIGFVVLENRYINDRTY